MKRVIEEEESKRADALEFLIELGVLQRCEYHPDTVFEDSGDLDHAYREASSAYKRGEHKGFSSQREFTDYIKDVATDHSADECPDCHHWKAD